MAAREQVAFVEPFALLDQVKEQLSEMRSAGVPMPEPVLQQIRLGQTQKGTFFSCEAGGRDSVLNPEHSAVRRLLKRPEAGNTSLYFLVSAIYSVLNRADPEIDDTHERKFHSRLVAQLLEGD